ncbi:ABC transporter substrate-binding protein [Halopiger djelfimassiliensis]|uniref:ABC transporter substrate-binding protein n=1 Tax=Halopiger djelfimassiliensis TaxID=1293047 RepID=UPI000678232A|nr:ABC transporter substrate-binding protein [Halopiger djelfimassiliensis]
MSTDPTAGTDSGGLDRRTLLAATGGSAVAVALAGCAELLQDEDDAAGDADVPDEPIDAGLQTFTEGAPAVLGVQAQYGAETAVRRINENGGVAGREIDLEVVNEGEEHLDNYRQFVDRGKDVTFGPISSGGHEEMVPEIEDQGVVNVATDGTVTTLYEEEFTDVTYSFRFQNHDVMEALAAVTQAVELLGEDEINTYAGINPNYAFGQDEMDLFSLGIERMTGADEVYSGFPELGTDDMSAHITEVNSESPDVVFSSAWGGDATLLLEQAQANNLFDNTAALVGTVLYGSANDMSEDLVQGPIYSGSRNFYWDQPPTDRWSPAAELLEEVRSEYGVVPTAHFMSGYGAVTAWATAAERAVGLLGRWPEQDEIAATLENHGFFTPAGYHMIGPDHQGYSNAHFGELSWSNEFDAAVLESVEAFAPQQVSPPPAETSRDWIRGW